MAKILQVQQVFCNALFTVYITLWLQKLSLENGLYMKNLDISRCERRRISGRRFSPHENTPAFAG